MKDIEIIDIAEDMDDEMYSFSEGATGQTDSDNITEPITADDKEDEEIVFRTTVEIPDEFVPCKNKEEIPIQDLYLSTSAVTERLGVTHRNVTIRYTSTFYDLLTVKKDPANNRYLYTEESVRQLAFIINDVKNSGRSFKQELEFLQSRDGTKLMGLASDNVGVIEKMFTQMQMSIIEANNASMKRMQEELLSYLKNYEASAQTKLLEDKHTEQLLEERMERQEQLLRSLLEEKENQIQELKQELEKKKKPFWKR